MATTTHQTGGRRRTVSKGDLRQQRILDTAALLFSRQPISAVSVDDLATGAGLSRSSFYFYFPSKNAVLAALMASVGDELTAGHSRWLDGTGRDDEAHRAATASVAVQWRIHGRLIQQARLSATDYQPVLTLLDEASDRFVTKLAGRIERDRAAGIAPLNGNSHTLARMVDALRSERFADLIGRRDARADARAVADVVLATNRLLYGQVPEQR
jgi:AcrR family transcriptional regulator